MVEARQDLLGDEANFEPIETCQLCGSRERTEKFRDGVFQVVECSQCGLVYVTPRLKPEVLPKVYDENYWSSDSPKEAGYADYRSDGALYLKTFEKRYELVQRFTDGEGRALDIGCAAGFFLKTLHDRGWHVDGVELSAEIAAHAQQEFGFDDIHVGMIETSPFQKGSYDLVSMWDVVEHVPEPLPFLQESVSYLKDDGILILETQKRRQQVRRSPRAQVAALQAPRASLSLQPNDDRDAARAGGAGDPREHVPLWRQVRDDQLHPRTRYARASGHALCAAAPRAVQQDERLHQPA
jgi:2-polyprenyl-3-methyl-5-hydroxy-6-metoxy-1,4-benzoquinol methylase